MKLILQYANISSTDTLDRWIKENLTALLPLARIDEAVIRVEYNHESSPRYRAVAKLAIPGPDVSAEAVDHTSASVCARLMATMREKLRVRLARRLSRGPDGRVLRHSRRGLSGGAGHGNR